MVFCPSEGQIIYICGKLLSWENSGLWTIRCRVTQIGSSAVGSVTQDDRLVVELVQRPDTPAAILIEVAATTNRYRSREAYGDYRRDRTRLGHAQIELAARRAAGL